MADPATITLAVKAAVAAATDKRTWKVVGIIVGAVLTPFILMIIMITSLLSATADHNNAAVDLTFHGGAVPAKVPPEYRRYIKDMRDSFDRLDDAVLKITSIIEDGSLDNIRIKAVFYSLFFGQSNALPVSSRAAQEFVSCFVRYEERTRTVTGEDGHKTKESYTAAIPIRDLDTVYKQLEQALNRTVTAENRINAAQIYSRVLYGYGLPNDGNISKDEWQSCVFDGKIYTESGDFASPLGENWRSMVTSEFGWRSNPFGSGGEGHSGIDLGAPKGTPIQAARSGVVSYVKNSGGSGYGYHLAIDHGDGMVTLYAHCSKVYVRSGQTVQQGDIIAAVGSTGRSTGNHLHFEVRINGKKVNPRQFLP